MSLTRRSKNIEARIQPGTPEEIDVLKKEKLLLKDQVYAVLKKAAAA